MNIKVIDSQGREYSVLSISEFIDLIKNGTVDDNSLIYDEKTRKWIAAITNKDFIAVKELSKDRYESYVAGDESEEHEAIKENVIVPNLEDENGSECECIDVSQTQAITEKSDYAIKSWTWVMLFSSFIFAVIAGISHSNGQMILYLVDKIGESIGASIWIALVIYGLKLFFHIKAVRCYLLYSISLFILIVINVSGNQESFPVKSLIDNQEGKVLAYVDESINLVQRAISGEPSALKKYDKSTYGEGAAYLNIIASSFLRLQNAKSIYNKKTHAEDYKFILKTNNLIKPENRARSIALLKSLQSDLHDIELMYQELESLFVSETLKSDLATDKKDKFVLLIKSKIPSVVGLAEQQIDINKKILDSLLKIVGLIEMQKESVYTDPSGNTLMFKNTVGYSIMNQYMEKLNRLMVEDTKIRQEVIRKSLVDPDDWFKLSDYAWSKGFQMKIRERFHDYDTFRDELK